MKQHRPRLMKFLVSLGAIVALSMGLAGMPSYAHEELALDHAPIVEGDKASLQRGAKSFANYCQSCHSAQYLRYSRLTDIGLSEEEIKANLMFASEKIGDTMTVAMEKSDAKAWFGNPPPDLSVEARVRGADWLYSYLRGFYKDTSRPTGWNNTVYHNVGMPHVLYELQGVQEMVGEEGAKSLKLVHPGKMSEQEYSQFTADLVNYLVWMAEPAKATRIQIGVLAIFFFVIAFFVTLALKKEFWKDIH
jgi:ubiquinol-cytochrome c reductase cytochrome c1 subunit